MGVRARVAGSREGEDRVRLVVDVDVRAGDTLARLPLWLSPVVLPPSDKRRGSKLHAMLAGLGLLVDLERKFGGQADWVSLEDVEDLAEWLDGVLFGQRVMVVTRQARSASGGTYSVVDSLERVAPSGVAA